MRLGSDRSSNIEDRRGFGVPIVGGGIGAGVLTIIALLFRGTPGEVSLPQQRQQQQPGSTGVDFVSAVLADTELTWHDVFRTEAGRDYVEPQLGLYTAAVPSAGGISRSATGAVYCSY